MRRLGWIVPVGLILALSGCATGTPSSPSSAGASTAPSAVHSCASHLELNYTHNGKAVCVTRGGSVNVSLGGTPGQEWAPLQVSPSQVLTTVPTSVYGPPNTTYGFYTAAAAGTVDITSSRSACPPPSPGSVACHAVQSFRVTVTVR